MAIKRKTDLAGELRKAIRDAGMTSYGLAKASGVNQSQTVRFMNGVRGVGLDTASKFCDVLGLELRPKRRKG